MAKDNQSVIGFVIGSLIKASSVYEPGGLTLMVDDFCVLEPDIWNLVGKVLLYKLQIISKNKGAVQILVVSGQHDLVKKRFIKSQSLNIISNWYHKSL